ncbi:S66 peptidase family protein [Parapedobacter sp. 10938]|uniref:S66 peptidase family protein n=1 Tax=Parapedobacter flavus TaxID=3110225 RepID=UPI002DB79256|nr:LD-carboxypeptidase [Parapedobacter sp. 10938]MEC3881051.1 LD-carboxypeptidase [Parapedobacter sp. 10938]
MDKRTFIKTLGLGMAALPVSIGGPAAVHRSRSSIHPPTIREGDTVGVITPSSALVDEEGYNIAEANIEALGLHLQWGQHVGKKYGYLAGKDVERMADLHAMFADPKVKAIVCLRGGSGAARLLDKLDYGLIARNPKIFMGYSDITAFHQAIYTQTGLITFHGAVANSKWTPIVFNQFKQLFFEGKPPVYSANQRPVRTLTPGTAEGKLLGGNLTVLTGLAGSRYYPDFNDSILFLEDIGEEPYRIDRMFSQLALSGALQRIKGFVFGRCSDCEASNPGNSLTLNQILDDYIKPLGIPAYQGALIGHMDEQFILPMGARVRIDADNGSITVAENIFSAG